MNDPARLGGIAWLERTNGSLTPAERWRLVPAILRGQAQAVASRIALTIGRRSKGPVEVPTPPDSAMARRAEEAAADQPAGLLGHAYRTWAYGRALAAHDRESGLDDELFYVAALLHDVGLVEAVSGEDFTLRSAACAVPVVEPDRPDGVLRARDAIAAHTTPGANVEGDGPEAFYVQAGAVCDLGGLRLNHLSADLVAAVTAEHDTAGLVGEIVPLIVAEARAVPKGRMALLRRTGFTLAVRFAPKAAR